MKTVITSKENTLQADFDLRFGRASYFCLFDDVSGSIEFIENPFAAMHENAGVKVTEKLKALGVEKVISGDFGPKAQELLVQHNIQMIVLPDNSQNVDEIISLLKS